MERSSLPDSKKPASAGFCYLLEGLALRTTTHFLQWSVYRFKNYSQPVAESHHKFPWIRRPVHPAVPASQ